MNEKIEKALKDLYETLTDEQKKKASACKTIDELTAYLGEEGIDLPDELLEDVGGGMDYPLNSGSGSVFRLADTKKPINALSANGTGTTANIFGVNGTGTTVNTFGVNGTGTTASTFGAKGTGTTSSTFGANGGNGSNANQ